MDNRMLLSTISLLFPKLPLPPILGAPALHAIWFSCNNASMLTANTAALVKMPPTEPLARAALEERTCISIPSPLLDWSFRSFVHWSSRETKLWVSVLMSLTKAIASSMTLYFRPWCSDNRIARIARLCSTRAMAASHSACCCDCTVWRKKNKWKIVGGMCHILGTKICFWVSNWNWWHKYVGSLCIRCNANCLSDMVYNQVHMILFLYLL